MKKSPAGSWCSCFSLGKPSSVATHELQHNAREPSETEVVVLAVESSPCPPRRATASNNDALCASINGELLRSTNRCSSSDSLHDNSDGQKKLIQVQALISPSSAEDSDPAAVRGSGGWEPAVAGAALLTEQRSGRRARRQPELSGQHRAGSRGSTGASAEDSSAGAAECFTREKIMAAMNWLSVVGKAVLRSGLTIAAENACQVCRHRGISFPCRWSLSKQGEI
ncbi:uncharacterized protein LOC124417860 [Gallus gallus]|uniref:uncharacterized protein LOC124417860 n=1 Tax=Gallus gallus TaxID=9031 RepID=UPI001F021CAA|nr:uncharacterized protein LOC124417860 [Gallus gallus]XP_046795547.1 uncharacterized protein LOC124417860 [Gallus gallus]